MCPRIVRSPVDICFGTRPSQAHAPRALKPYLIGQEHGRSIPFSKLSEEDNEAGELDKAEEVLSVEFPADEYAALPFYPGEETLDEPASHIASMEAAWWKKVGIDPTVAARTYSWEHTHGR
jgi:hypothetical protein